MPQQGLTPISLVSLLDFLASYSVDLPSAELGVRPHAYLRCISAGSDGHIRHRLPTAAA